jgi:DNA-binding transcriptional ArsR family regulator
MGQAKGYLGHNSASKNLQRGDFVLDRSIFSNVFEKDIRRVFIYKKAERIAKALTLISPAFAGNLSFKNRLDAVTLGLVDAAMRSPQEARTLLPRELLSLSSLLSVSRTAGILSAMNAEIILQEGQALLEEVAGYEEPTLSLEEVPSISSIAKTTLAKNQHTHAALRLAPPANTEGMDKRTPKGHLKDSVETNELNKDRKGLILSVIKNKNRVSIKDISMMVRGVSEKTIQRELSVLIDSGLVIKTGERRWSTYSLA